MPSGRERAQPAPSASRLAPRALVFRLGDRVLAAPSGAGHRVLEIEECTRVPTGPEHLLGLVASGGTVLPVVDLRPVLGLPQPPWSWPITACVTVHGGIQVAFPVDEILGLDGFDPQTLTPVEGATDGLKTYGRGWAGPHSRRAILLDVPRLIAALKVQPGPGGVP